MHVGIYRNQGINFALPYIMMCDTSNIATIMAYGQTGAGKTFTMTGDTGNYRLRGIIPRAVSQVTIQIDHYIVSVCLSVFVCMCIV